jgi:hypothetical protein
MTEDLLNDELALGGGDDDEFSVDFSEAVEFLILPAAWYHVEVVYAERAESGPNSKVPGTPQLAVRMKVQDEHGEWAGQTLFANWALRGKGSGFTKAALKAILGDVPSSNRFRKDDVLGAHLEVFCRPRIRTVEQGGTGEEQNSVNQYRAYGGFQL